jgi:EpsI family protein
VYLDAGKRPIGLYVGYYGSQRQGDTMHSPLNCLPGAGWSPVSFRRMSISVPSSAEASRDITVNRYVIEKGLDRQLVLYWYQGHGRVVASEYLGKIYMVLDAIRTNRTDGAMVRIIAPIVTDEAHAEAQAVGFAQVLFPLLGRYLPD